MEMLSRLRWFIIGFFVLIFLLLVGWGLASIARNIFTGGSSSSNQAILNSNDIDISSVSSARFTVSGPIVATDEHRSYVIEVNERLVTITLYSDYGQKQLEKRSYKNNTQAYEEFIAALDKAQVLERRKGTSEENDHDYEGACPTGRRYIVQLDEDITRWTTSCDSARGTMGGSVRTIRRLFNNQAPDALEILKGTRLYVN